MKKPSRLFWIPPGPPRPRPPAHPITRRISLLTGPCAHTELPSELTQLAIDTEHNTLRITRRAVEIIDGRRENCVRMPPARLRRGASGGIPSSDKVPAPEEADMDGDAWSLFSDLKAWRDRKADAHEWLGKIRAVNPKHLEALALAGALAYVEGDTAAFEARGAEALKVHPAYGEYYRVTGSVTAGSSSLRRS